VRTGYGIPVALRAAGKASTHMMRPRVLVVDDVAGVRDGLRTFLQRKGYEVETAADALGAVRWIKRKSFECALVDMDLSPDAEMGMNGLDVVALLRIHQPGTRAILISASADTALTRLALRRGAVARLEKPVDLAVLVGLLQHLAPPHEDTPGGNGAELLPAGPDRRP